MEALKKKKQLVEELGVYFEKAHQLPPMATRLHALLILGPRSGHTFDEIVELSDSSKSTVSTNLNLLLNNGSIEYFTKPGDRKRYFRLSKNYLRLRLEKYKNQLAVELDLLRKIDNYNFEYNKEKYEAHKEFGSIYINYLENQYKNLEDTIHKMNQIERKFS